MENWKAKYENANLILDCVMSAIQARCEISQQNDIAAITERLYNQRISAVKRDHVMNQPTQQKPVAVVLVCCDQTKEDENMSDTLYELRNKGKEPSKLTMSELQGYCKANCHDNLRQLCRLQAKQQGFVNCGVSYGSN